jgi:uncharacterized protein (TIGR00730 family)
MSAARDRGGVRSICVFCSSSTVIDPRHIDTAAAVGTEIGRRGWTLVSGGGTVGSMGAVARAARAGGARTIGVIPRALVAQEVADHDADVLVVTDDMRERKGVMDARCDAFLALPGGLGTLEELLEVWVARSLGMHAKPVVVLDPDGTFDGLRALVDALADAAFVRPEARDTPGWARTVEEAFSLIEEGWSSPGIPPEPTPEEVIEAEP